MAGKTVRWVLILPFLVILAIVLIKGFQIEPKKHAEAEISQIFGTETP